MLVPGGLPVHTIPSCLQPKRPNIQQQGFLAEELEKVLLADIQLWQIVAASASERASFVLKPGDTCTSTQNIALASRACVLQVCR